MELAWVIHRASSFAMAGLIALVHFVHYPLFERVGESEPLFLRYHAEHSARITPVVMFLMGAELVSSAALIFHSHPHAVLLLALTALTWAITGIAAVPAHHSLSQGFRPDRLRRLLRADLLRALVWWGKAGLLLHWDLS